MKRLPIIFLAIVGLMLMPIVLEGQTYLGKFPPTAAFRNITEGTANITASSYADLLTLTAGTNMTITVFPANNTIRFASTGVGEGAISNIHSIGNVTFIGCAVGEGLTVNASAVWDCTSLGGADNLGNHIATMFLNMSDFSIINFKNITSSSNEEHFIDIGRSAVLADNDIIGFLRWTGLNDNSDETVFAEWRGEMEDDTAGSESGSLRLRMMDGGSLNAFININPNGNNQFEMNRLLRVAVTNGAVFNIIRDGSVTTAERLVGLYRHTTTGLMGDGFGGRIDFELDDSNSPIKDMGRLSWARLDDDTSGTIELSSFNSSSKGMTLELIKDDELTIGNTGGEILSINSTFIDVGTTQLAGSMTCTDEQILEYNSTSDIWECLTQPTAANLGGWSIVRKTADETIQSDDTYTNDGELFFSVDGNSVYFYQFGIRVSADSTADFKYRMVVPSGAVCAINGYAAWDANTVSTETSCTTSTPVGTSGLGSDQTVIGWGFIDTSGTSGTANFQWAQNNNTAADTTLLENTYLQFMKITP